MNSLQKSYGQSTHTSTQSQPTQREGSQPPAVAAKPMPGLSRLLCALSRSPQPQQKFQRSRHPQLSYDNE